MKRLVAGILAATMLASTAACSSGNTNTESTAPASSTAAATSDVTLRIAWWGSQTRHDATLKVLDMYTKKTGVKFQTEYMPFDGYFTKLNTLVASNDMYDIFQLGGNFPTYIDQIEPLDSYVADGTIDTTDTNKGYLESTQYNGKQYGISLGINSYGIAYDPEMFQKAGLKEPSTNWTWEEFEKDCMTIHEKLNIYGSSKIEDFFAGGTMAVPQFNLKESFFKADGTGLNYTDDSPIASYLAMKQRLVKAGAYPDPGAISEIKDIEGDYLATGDAAMTWVASNQFVALSKAAGRPLKLATVPRIKADGPSGISLQSSQMFAISKSCKEKTEAAKFLNYFVNDIQANEVLLGERGIPIMSKVRDDVKSKISDNDKQVYNFIDTVGEIADSPVILDPKAQPEIKDLYMRLENQVVSGKLSPEDAAKQLRSGAEDIFKKGASASSSN